MQIVRDLGGYTLGRSDLVRRAMSKKKGKVMEEERKNFVYGNPEQGVNGCIANGIPEAVANHIYDEMIDFAKYAFNKSHAAAYAVVSYQTAWLKYYYPVEFMAALMTSVRDNSTKVSEYIMTCRQMGIGILPPDINEGESGFSAAGDKIRYGLSAIRSVGYSVVESIIRERQQNGPYRTLEDFVDRMAGKEVNRRTIESFIKSGAMDSMPGTRKQKYLVSGDLLDQKNKEKKNTMAGQISMFDIVDEDEKKNFRVSFPNVGEYSKEELLAFEKETLGVYVSGHPLEAYEGLWQKNVSAKTTDFVVDEETGRAAVEDGARVVLGGMITQKTIKTTRSNQVMAFVTLEDMAGSVEVLVFPKDYEKHRGILNTDAKVFMRGRVSLGDEPVGKLIAERILPFEEVPAELWLQFTDMDQYRAAESWLAETLKYSDGQDSVVIYLKKERAKKVLPKSQCVKADEKLLDALRARLGDGNVKIVWKRAEFLYNRDRLF